MTQPDAPGLALLHDRRLSVLAALLASLAVIAAIVLALSADPFTVFSTIVDSSLGSKFTFGQTVMIGAILVLTGLAAAIPFSAHLWNVGGEGQLYFGAFAAFAATQVVGGLPGWLLPFVVLAAGMAAGALWGLIPGVLKTVADANEVITSLMMSFVAILVAGVAINDIWPEGFGGQTESIPANAALPYVWQAADIDIGIVVALVAAVVAWVLIARTRVGFEIRAAGLNPRAARAGGIDVRRLPMVTFALGGACAGAAGAIAVVGVNDSLIQNFSQNYGFLGIAVAIVARLNPLAIVPSAALFAILSVGSNGLEVQAGLSPAMGQILGAVFVIMLLAFQVVRLRYPEAGTS
ncbi:MAG TPA: ABC transporter permease [Thermoleophilaceae bacterium]|nr:ABC transporter permease [Thermoleophilaceae bacterium]